MQHTILIDILCERCPSRPTVSSGGKLTRRWHSILRRLLRRGIDAFLLKQLQADNFPAAVDSFDSYDGIIAVLADMHVPPVADAASRRPLSADGVGERTLVEALSTRFQYLYIFDLSRAAGIPVPQANRRISCLANASAPELLTNAKLFIIP